MKNNTIVTAGDAHYAWGVWLLIASIRKNGMDEPILVGTYHWPRQWIDDIKKFPGVETAELSLTDRRSVTCSKPEIILRAQTEYVTWLDCDGIFTGNCSDVIGSKPGEIYIRSRTAPEIEEIFRKQRRPGEEPGEIPAAVLDIWQRDVGEHLEPRRRRSCSAGIFTIHRDSLPFMRRWIEQMKKVLPADVMLVEDGSIAYFQTDDAVLNSLLLYAYDAPEISREYHADDTSRAFYAHFAFSPKPWIMWNSYSMRYYDQTMAIVAWAAAGGYLPTAGLPYSLRKECGWFFRRSTPGAKWYSRWLKLRRKCREWRRRMFRR
ncbi:MAG: hypothetical protein PHQ27_05780 [Victivallales bacterium]|nr:hypothetical protein [Victivallales bacterium]